MQPVARPCILIGKRGARHGAGDGAVRALGARCPHWRGRLGARLSRATPRRRRAGRGQIYTEAGTPGLLAFVVSANKLSKEDVTHQVMGQLSALLIQLGQDALRIEAFKVIQTVVEKRATFACIPNLKRPSARPCQGITVCGDYVEGPYPATLEGAIISGIQAVP